MSRLFRWEGIDLPYPSKISWSFADISSEETKRTLDGTMKKDVIATKRKLQCSWNCKIDSEAKVILNNVKTKIFGTLSYPDPFGGTDVTKTFYTGDATADMIFLSDGIARWNISFDFIEK